MDLIICLHNIRSTLNVGAILRTAEGFGAVRVLFSGYTPVPIQPEQVELMKRRGVLPHIAEKITKEIAKTALGAELMVAIEFEEDVISGLKNLKKDGYKIVGLENNIVDKRLVKISEIKDKDLGGKVVLVLGEEVNGITRELYPLIDWFLEIPMQGRKESFNVSVAAGVAMYELKRSWL